MIGKYEKILFILTYSEADHWVHFYTDEVVKKVFPKDIKLIILDNGDQQIMKKWADDNNAIYYKSQNNLGTTGGYNFFIRLGALLKAKRIGVMQADVFVHHPLAIQYLFQQKNGEDWNTNNFVYYPNRGRTYWTEGEDGDVGQFFSINPTFFLENNYLCDENYTITHFESIDLWIRINKGQNPYPAVPINLLKLYFGDCDLVDKTSTVYSYQSYSNNLGEHDNWFHYNWDYFKRKLLDSSMQDLDSKTGFAKFLNGQLIWKNPWVSSPELQNYAAILLHRNSLDVHRNLAVNQVPYPVEYEVNSFYLNFIKQNIDESYSWKKFHTLDHITPNIVRSILIIGSSGYIGSALVSFFRGFDCYTITTVDTKMFGGISPHFKVDYKLLNKDFYKKFSHIILLAGHSSMAMCQDNYSDAWDNNVTKFADLLAKLDSNQTLIYASSGSVYGQDGKGRSEYMTLASAQEEYDLTKQMIEKLAYGAKCKTIGLRFGTVNGFSKYARSDLFFNAMVINALTNNKIDCYNGINHRSILGINDCVSAIEQIVAHSSSFDNNLEQHEIFNLASFSGSIRSFAESAGNILNVPVNYHAETTNLFSFELDTSKFVKTLKFEFKDNVQSIVKGLMDNYSEIVWTNRIPQKKLPPSKGS